jgi:hypothetical protein
MKIPDIKDPYTEDEFTPKRHNQKFEKEQNRIDYNNEKARKLRLRKKNTDSIIRKNYRILDELMQNEPLAKEIDKLSLINKGFSFRHFTTIETRGNISYYAVYDYILINLPNEHYKIERYV